MTTKLRLTLEELNPKTVKELRTIAKDYDISGRWDMTKPQLIAAIYKADVKNNESAKVEEEIGNEVDFSLEDSKKQDNFCPATVEAVTNVIERARVNSNAITKSVKLEYISKSSKGTLIAFKLGDKIKTGMVTNKSAARRVLKVESKIGKEYIVPYDDVVWVRTGRRWPKGVYNLLKGGSIND